MTNISEEQTRQVADLARLELSDDEVELFTKQLADIITYAEKLNELDTTGVEPLSHVHELKNVLREDKARTWISRDEALENAPDHEGGLFKVPTILE